MNLPLTSNTYQKSENIDFTVYIIYLQKFWERQKTKNWFETLPPQL